MQKRYKTCCVFVEDIEHPLEHVMLDFYKQHNSQKSIESVRRILALYKDRYEEMLNKMQQRYGKAPDLPISSLGSRKQANAARKARRMVMLGLTLINEINLLDHVI